MCSQSFASSFTRWKKFQAASPARKRCQKRCTTSRAASGYGTAPLAAAEPCTRTADSDSTRKLRPAKWSMHRLRRYLSSEANAQTHELENVSELCTLVCNQARLRARPRAQPLPARGPRTCAGAPAPAPPDTSPREQPPGPPRVARRSHNSSGSTLRDLVRARNAFKIAC